MEETKQSKQPEPGRKADGKPKETKPLTPEEVRRRRKMLAYPLMLLVFGGAMWLIFAPSESGEPLQDGFNVEVPMPEEKGMPSDKRAAYELQAFERRQKEKMNTLQDLAVAESDGNDGADEDVFQTQEPAEAGQSSIRTSADAYRDINRQIGSFYEQPEPEDDQKTLELEWRIQELERQAEEDRRAKEAADEQLQLMEKSYEMASRYLPQNDVKSVPTTAGTDKPKAVPVTQVSEQVVSRLAQLMSDAEFMERYSRPHNMGFHTVTDQAHTAGRNSIRACIYRTVTVSDGKEAEIRLLEPVEVGDTYIPANTVLTATARINGERMDLSVTSVAYKGTIMPVELEVYDTGGMKGISVPGSQELTALKEMAANMGSTMGSSISISTDAGAQLASDLGRGVIQGMSQYLSTKFRTVRVTIKAGHEVLLVARK
ncbi:conjugative transposon protein TraM [Phocaeicola plebeius]|uniref:conjugative transposon protein TraM n=1 Tax=Phocaeicola plebeius TaxID=310297 RepID=UPI0019582251|nr:conjugative transposon protein TraM [Phocaeicola plebeius]MBM6844309.1 conjugative transposon protein TraM [Phocaeicola plebeius]